MASRARRPRAASSTCCRATSPTRSCCGGWHRSRATEGKKLIIGPPPKGARLTIGPGDGARKVKVRIQSNSQVGEIAVHGYDPKTKKEIVGKAKGQGVIGEGTKYGKGKTLSFAGHEHQPKDQATAESMAKGRMRKLAEGHVVASIEAIGDPRMLPGATVKLEKLGAQIDGSYRIEKALHLFSKHGYLVNFKAVRVAKVKPPAAAKPAPAQAAQPAQSWVEIKLKDSEGNPASDEACRVVTSDGRVLEGTLDSHGRARVQDIKKGQCKISFPNLSADDWSPA